MYLQELEASSSSDESSNDDMEMMLAMSSVLRGKSVKRRKIVDFVDHVVSHYTDDEVIVYC